jgi:hypothetical protein
MERWLSDADALFLRRDRAEPFDCAAMTRPGPDRHPVAANESVSVLLAVRTLRDILTKFGPTGPATPPPARPPTPEERDPKRRLVRDSRTLPDGTTFVGRRYAECQGWLLSLDRRWFRRRVHVSSVVAWIEDTAEPIEGGMSGSPIVTDEGRRSALYRSQQLRNR